MKCSDCGHKQRRVEFLSRTLKLNQGVYFSVARSNLFRRARLKGVWCLLQRTDPDFPLKFAEMSNWDETLLPKYCGGFVPAKRVLVFSLPPDVTLSRFMGSYKLGGTADEAVKHTKFPLPVMNLITFKKIVTVEQLHYIMQSLIVKLPLDEGEISYEFSWNLLQSELFFADADGFKKQDAMSAWDWIRYMFPKVGCTASWKMLSRWGDFSNLTVQTVLRDLRKEKYARGVVMDIRPLHPYFTVYTSEAAPLTKTKEAELKRWGEKMYVRVK